MAESRRYWNADAQCWEDPADRGRLPTVTDPPSPTALTPPPRHGGFHGRVGEALMAATAVVVAAAAVLTLLLAAGDGESTGGEGSTGGSGSTGGGEESVGDGGESTGDGGQATTEPEALPAGYQWYDEGDGFAAVIPDGWGLKEKALSGDRGHVGYGEDFGPRVLFLSNAFEAPPEESFQESGQSWAEVLAGPEFFIYGDVTGQQMEYRVPATGVNEAEYFVEIRFEAIDGLYWSLSAGGRDRALNEERALLDVALEHFCPVGVRCEG
ncbi:hypothetical protein [Streptomyces sedi]|uniref:Uncharacterized protein n=1 Tax=Streptomyces sedi TaxID=555059 RepID=A0A5C4VEP8_9ACTN|nr:hypothetical protein [Streptomyces sedi]TNM33499.1 hypothetical protein FH715_03860 [Streptomyces sedi]